MRRVTTPFYQIPARHVYSFCAIYCTFPAIEEDFEDTTYYRWEDLRDEDVFVRLYATAGNRKRKLDAKR